MIPDRTTFATCLSHSEFCIELRDIGRQAVVKAAQVDDPITKYQSTLDNLAAKKKNIDRRD